MARDYPDRPLLGVGAVVLRGGDVLLVRRAAPPAAGRWSVPGGLVEPGETLREAAAREVHEETGLTARIGPLLEVVERVERDGDGRVRSHYVIVDFVATVPEQAAAPRGADDAAEARWVPLDQVEHLDVTDGLLPVLRKAVALLAC